MKHNFNWNHHSVYTCDLVVNRCVIGEDTLIIISYYYHITVKMLKINFYWRVIEVDQKYFQTLNKGQQKKIFGWIYCWIFQNLLWVSLSYEELVLWPTKHPRIKIKDTKIMWIGLFWSGWGGCGKYSLYL